jgi:ribonucleoside-diphosphate reductase alpha chain
MINTWRKGVMTLSTNSELIFKERYSINEDEDWQGLSLRVANGGAQVENNWRKWQEIFAYDIYNMLFLPGGRILRNVGRPRGTLFNCYVEPLDDSMDQIGEFQKNCGVLWSEGGGVGCNASFLRPDGAPIIQKGGNSSGPISFLKWANAGANCIKVGGSRRAAALAMMNVSHPDIIKFINAKLVDGELNCFNISVAVTEDFLQAVEADDEWDLKWRNKVWDTVPARKIWDLILENMVKCAEPGLINWDNLRSNNSYYFDPILSTNPCGEVPLGAHGVCCLGSLVLPNFITGKTNTNWQLMEKTVYNAVRFLDNIIQINRYVIDDIKRKAFDGRRIGLGVMGLAEYLFSKGVRYGSKEAIRVTETLMENIRNFSYEASCKIASEKEPFPKYDVKEYSKAHFFKTLPAYLRMNIKKYGMRNVSVMAVAPTGTISLIPEVTSSIEPLFCKAYLRNDQISKRAYVHPIYKNIIDNEEETPDWYVDSFDLKPEDHFETQVAVQKYLDGAVSKTVNCPRGFKAEELSDLLLEYIRDLKGVTVYRDGSREGQILNPLTYEETLDFIKEDKIIEDQEERSCSTGSCEI